MRRTVPTFRDKLGRSGIDAFVCGRTSAGHVAVPNQRTIHLPRPITYCGAITCVPPTTNLPAIIAPSAGVTRVGWLGFGGNRRSASQMTPFRSSMVEIWSSSISPSGDCETRGASTSCSFFTYSGCLASSNKALASVVLVVSLWRVQ